tara:strand:+ start:1855 stop:2241 length:387 start_codon:yes stop_codon:yes gene_type:complete
MTKSVRLDIRDLPRDPQHFQGGLRIELVKMANYVRKFPKKAPALIESLEFAIAHVNMNINGVPEEKDLSVVDKLKTLVKEVSKLTSKKEVIEAAAKISLSLDETSNRSELNAALLSKYAELIKIQEGK